MNQTKVLTTTLLISVALSIPCNAALVTLSFTATVSDVPAALASQFTVGDAVVGSYTFESTTAPTGSNYLFAVTTFNVGIAGYAISANRLGDIGITNGSTDSYLEVALSNGAAVGGQTPELHAIQLNDPTGTALSDTSLPVLPPDLSKFSNARFTVDFSQGSRLTAQMNTFVPEPSSVGLVGSLLLAGLFSRRRR